jgi:glutamate-ammonia-ligase adenylyltransferase
VKEALKGSDPDLAILQLVDFSALLATRESYLEAISQRQEIISSLTFVFSHSEYLTKILMSSPYYIESLVEEEIRKKRKSLLRGELKALMERYGDAAAVRLFRRLKELRVGILFLNQSLSARDLLKSLTKVADTVLSSLLVETPSLTVIGLGKLGGREIIFNSDLDIIFLTRDEPETGEIKGAERLLKVATLYTKEGIAYRIDTRLRPEGNKGPLVNSLQGLRHYYLRSAKPWELQALTKARPVNAERVLGKAFMDMREEVLTKRGAEVTLSEVRRMRERIQRELSKEAPTAGIYDIKLGPGGLEDLEFSVQYLQLRHCAKEPRLLVQGTIEATKRLNRAGYLGDGEAQRLSEIYTFYRTIETVLRLRNESVLKRGTDVLQSLAHFLDMEMERLPSTLEEKRGWMKEFWDRLE